MKTLISAELQKKVTVTENGKRVRRSKREIAATQLTNKAARGDTRAITIILQIDEQALRRTNNDISAAPNVEPISESDRRLLEWFAKASAEKIAAGNSDPLITAGDVRQNPDQFPANPSKDNSDV